MTAPKPEDFFQIHSPENFESLAFRVFEFQYGEVPIYRKFCDLLGRLPGKISELTDIPFLPISFFKSDDVISTGTDWELEFLSSGTTLPSTRSVHKVKLAEVYHKSLEIAFRALVGNPEEFELYSLLPGYNENPQSSLIHMIDFLGRKSVAGRVLNFQNRQELAASLNKSASQGRKAILFGVSFALLDLASEIKGSAFPNLTIIETGGMKGRRKEITRHELHEIIGNALSPDRILSEYGMTELLSQAYTYGGEEFRTPSWMKVFVRDIQDPLSVSRIGNGTLNIIDLANLHSCSFIATDDLGIIKENGEFLVLGRTDNSEIRGCNLLHPV